MGGRVRRAVDRVVKLLSPDELETELRAIGAERYHHLHPFHRLLHGGGCSKGQVQAWALNRYCYQAIIPRKDAMLIARCDDPDLRRAWRTRLVDHDGEGPDDGGLARWLNANGLRVMGWLVGAVGIGLIAQGVAAASM